MAVRKTSMTGDSYTPYTPSLSMSSTLPPAPPDYSYNGGLDYSRSQQPTGNKQFDAIQMPGYVKGYDPETMSMTDYLESIQGDYSAGFDAFRDQALNKGPSAWLTMSGLGQDLEAQTARERAAREGNASTAQAMDQLASRGGLSSGARERATEAGSKNYLGMSQDVSRQNTQNKLNLGIQDQTNKISMLQALPGMENQKIQQWEGAKSSDINNQLAEISRLTDYNKSLYDSRMTAAAAERQAKATENSGKGGK